MIFIRFSLIVVYLFSAIWGDLMKRIRIALLGAAHDHSTATLETVLRYPDIFEVVSITESNEEVRRTHSSLPAYQHLPGISEEMILMQFSVKVMSCWPLTMYSAVSKKAGMYTWTNLPAQMQHNWNTYSA